MELSGLKDSIILIFFRFFVVREKSPNWSYGECRQTVKDENSIKTKCEVLKKVES